MLLLYFNIEYFNLISYCHLLFSSSNSFILNIYLLTISIEIIFPYLDLSQQEICIFHYRTFQPYRDEENDDCHPASSVTNSPILIILQQRCYNILENW